MLGEVARKAEYFLHQIEKQLRLLPGCAHALLLKPLFKLSLPVPPGQGLGQILYQHGVEAQGLADIADSTSRAIGDDCCRQGGPSAGIFAVDILNDFFTAFVLKVNVDIRGFIPLPGDETFKQQIDLLGIHLGNMQAITDHGICCGAAPLAQDISFPCKADKVVYRQEVVFIVEFGNEREFVLDTGLHSIGYATRPALRGSQCDLFPQVGICVLAGRYHFLRIFVPQFVQAELTLLADPQGLPNQRGWVER